MLGFGWLLIPALGGYWLLMHCYWTRFTAERASGYHLFFQSAIAGGFLVVVAYVFTSLGTFLCPQGSVLWTCWVPFDYSGTAVLSAVLGWASPLLVNVIYSKEKAAERVAEQNGDLIELLLQESMERQFEVEVSLRSGKSYIGFPLNTGLGVKSESDIALIPLASGYRKQDTHKLEITTHYSPVIREFLGDTERGIHDLVYEDFRVIIPMSEIVSARLFDVDVYNRFQEPMQATPPSS